MKLTRTIAVFFLALGVALGSMAAVVSATEQAFAKPCPMHDQGGEADCCKGDCTGAMMGCSIKCSVPLNTATLSGTEPKLMSVAASAPKIAWSSTGYDPFIARPPPPIPIV